MPPILTESKYKFWPDVINDLKRLLETDENYDVIVYVGEEPNVREFHVHSLILGCRSQYFLNLFSKNINERKDECFIFKIPNISSYTFNQILRLLFRSSRDGIYGKSFHEKCDNKGPTIIIAKIKETKKLIGGYNPLGWEDDIGSRKIGRIIKPNDAIRCFKGWGPIFGDLNGDSNDLVMTSLGHWSSSSGSYEDVGIPNQFKVEEWEVFQIKKRKV
ncbi:hypothetical protein C1645_731420 [Glomus cerebriforme]|uniref:BTB domain-containing protein n=1 Tax=Glomus cerebriforme TaxID=658196 RepID=A0A397TU67_9GLOM|nr:hypothetical protein C1645_731420 [Glomus cerebriforme]